MNEPCPPDSPGPPPLGAPSPWRVAALAAAVLLLELTFIRLVPAEVRAISYFTNLLLMAAFFGLGLGCILQDARRLGWLVPAGCAGVLAFVLATRGLVVHAEGAVHLWLQYGDLIGQARRLPLVPVAATAFLLSALPFVGLGQALANEMNHHPRLRGYGFDLGGSLLGTLVFTLASFLQLPPWVWPPLLLGGWAALFVRGWGKRALCLAVGLAFLVLARAPHPSAWSPYYLVQHQRDAHGLRVFVNSSFHQYALDFSASDPESERIQDMLLAKWGRLYDLYQEHHGGQPPRKVLILGAGTGNDVNVALSRGAEEVVAVEIDPVILGLGQRENPSRPYASPKVRAVVDDARHFLRASEERFDLIVFATIDSQVLLSGAANLRLENYVHTVESLRAARERLTPEGMVGVYYSVLRPWLRGRVYSTVEAVFGAHMRIETFDTPFLFNTLIVGAPAHPALKDNRFDLARYAGQRPSSDDWPFLYLERPTIAPLYLQLAAIVGLLIGGAFVVLRRRHGSGAGSYASFFFLGLGFTLLESSAIVRLSLLFGSTWTVNAVVFASVLLTVFLANLAVLRERAPSLRVAWAGLLLSVLAGYLVPVGALVELATPLRVLLAGLAITAPVFCAAICFSRLFARQETTGYALGINLIGAMCGGLLEYASMPIGMRAVWLVVLGVYALACVTSPWARARVEEAS